MVQNFAEPDFVRFKIIQVRGSRNRNTFLSNLKSGISGHGLTVKEVTEQVGDKEKGFILLYADDKLLEYYAEQLQIELPLSQVFKLMIRLVVSHWSIFGRDLIG